MKPTPDSPVRRAAHGAAHLALWAGMYVAGAVVFLAQITGLDGAVSSSSRFMAAAFAFCTATAVYLLDRVKLRDAWLDPADAQAHPDRFAFLAHRSRIVRMGALVLLVAASIVGALLHPMLAGAPLAAACGVVLYAGKPRGERPRPKDIVLVKNAYVAAGITGFAAIMVLIGSHPGVDLASIAREGAAHAWPFTVACVLLAARVFADAVVCDLDDEHSDRMHGTRTLPTHLGRRRAWNIAFVARMAIVAALVAIPAFPLHARIAWAIVTAASSVVLRAMNPVRVRDWVDGRLAAEALIVTAVLMAW